jgi:hypothetical protein
MSYTLVSAVGKAVGSGGRWTSIDIGNLTFLQIYQGYTRVIATLSNPFDNGETALDLADIEYEIPDQTVTFNQYLINIGNASLPTTTTLPVLKTSYAKYSDAFLAGYNVQAYAPNAAPDSQLPDSAKTWLYLTQEGVDFTLFGKSCMVTVNGFYHYLDTDITGAYVRDGMVSQVKSGDNQIGIYNLGYLGELTYIDLVPSMIYKQVQSATLSQGVYINIGQDITDQTVILVIGGYMHVLDPLTFTRVGDTTIKIDWPNFPYFNRYFESQEYIDMTPLGLTHNNVNPSQVGVADLMSDRAITAYCSLSQSFIVLLNNQEVFRDKQFVKSLTIPNTMTSFVKPEYPLIVGHGRVAEYWPQYETGQWGLAVRNNLDDRMLFNKRNPKTARSITNQRIPFRPTRIGQGEFLMFGTDISNL